MTRRLRPSREVAADAILVGDPGRALLLAQELLEEPRMSNHARGLWGYTGVAAGRELTIQSTGTGGASAAAVLEDLAELGVRRAIRVGTCAAAGPQVELGALLLVESARPNRGLEGAFGVAPGENVRPDAELQEALAASLGEDAPRRRIASLDLLGAPASSSPRSDEEAAATDLQTATVLACARARGIAAAAVLIASEGAGRGPLGEERLEAAVKRAGAAAAGTLSG